MDKDREARMKVAQDKLGLIAPVLNGTFPDVTKSAYYRRVAERPITMADGSSVRVKASTIASWERRYRAGGFEALVPKARCDIGTSRKIDADLGADIDEMRAAHPKMGAQMVLDAHEALPGPVVEVAMVVAVVGVVAGRAAIRARLLRGLAAPLGVA